jgi:hypothetical protein
MRFLIIITFFTFHCSAQLDSVRNDWSISLKPKSGFLAAHRATMSHLPKERIWGAELSIYKRLYNSTSWSKSYKNPFIGMTIYGSTLGNKAILGFGAGSYAFIEFPMSRKDRKNCLTAKLSAGLGYVSKIFSQSQNPKNVATSSHLNALLCLGLQGRWQFHPNHCLIYSMDMTHFSNGSSKVPNLGLNMPFLGLGYGYTFAHQKVSYCAPKTFQKTPFFSNWKLTLVGIASFKEMFPTGGKVYPVYALNSFVSKQFKSKVGMEFGLDFISKQSLFNYKPYIPKTQWSIFQMGTYAAYVLPLNKLRFVLGMGVYLKDRYDSDDEIYHRVGMRYYCSNGLELNLVLKSHWAKADYVEYGIGYTFGKKQLK